MAAPPPLSRCSDLASAGVGCSLPGRLPARHHERRDAVDGCQADEAIDDSAAHVRVAEVHAAEDPGDKIELREGDEPPVEPAHEHECCGDDVQLLHSYDPLMSLVSEWR